MSSEEDTTEEKENQEYFSESLDPLKTHFGIDIPIPKPIQYIVMSIVWLFFALLRFLVYSMFVSIITLIAFFILLPVNCLLFPPSDIVTCFKTGFTDPILLIASVAIGLGCTTIVAMIDSQISWNQYF